MNKSHSICARCFEAYSPQSHFNYCMSCRAHIHFEMQSIWGPSWWNEYISPPLRIGQPPQEHKRKTKPRISLINAVMCFVDDLYIYIMGRLS